MSEEENKDEESSMNNYSDDEEEDDEEEHYSNNEIDRIFEEVLLSYITSSSINNAASAAVRPPTTPTPYYYSTRRTTVTIPSNLSMFDFRYPESATIRRLNSNIRNLNDAFLDRIIDSVIDPFESVLNQSFNEQPSVEKNNEAMEIDSSKYSEINIEKEKECCICLESFVDEDDVSFSKCQHLFHTKCIKEWSMYKQTCPVCRKNFEE